jgi:hypothetical protein
MCMDCRGAANKGVAAHRHANKIQIGTKTASHSPRARVKDGGQHVRTCAIAATCVYMCVPPQRGILRMRSPLQRCRLDMWIESARRANEAHKRVHMHDASTGRKACCLVRLAFFGF